MTTEKCDLHTIEYSVQGADTILATDMEKIDDLMPTREILTLGETVVAGQALYQSSLDTSKRWYKAKADGIRGPCQAIAVEGGDEGDEIRGFRMGKFTNAGWTWDVGPIFLSGTTAGALTQTDPVLNSQIIGYAISATEALILIAPMASHIYSRGGTVLTPTEAVNVIVWSAPYACTVKAVKGYRVGGTGATVNARKNGASNHLASNLSLTSTDVWMDGGAVQNADYAAGDKMEIMIVTVAGDPAQVAVQIDLSTGIEPVGALS